MKEYATIVCVAGVYFVEWFDQPQDALTSRAVSIARGYQAWVVTCPDVIPVIDQGVAT